MSHTPLQKASPLSLPSFSSTPRSNQAIVKKHTPRPKTGILSRLKEGWGMSKQFPWSSSVHTTKATKHTVSRVQASSSGITWPQDSAGARQHFTRIQLFPSHIWALGNWVIYSTSTTARYTETAEHLLAGQNKIYTDLRHCSWEEASQHKMPTCTELVGHGSTISKPRDLQSFVEIPPLDYSKNDTAGIG